MPEIALPTAGKQDEILNKLMDGTGTDWSKYVPFSFSQVVTSSTANSPLTILDVQGSGFVHRAVIGSASNGISSLKIYTDGSLYLVIQVNNVNDASGIIASSDLNSSMQVSVWQLSRSVSKRGNYSPNITLLNTIATLSIPIPFKDSLLVTAETNMAGGTFFFDVVGGVSV